MAETRVFSPLHNACGLERLGLVHAVRLQSHDRGMVEGLYAAFALSGKLSHMASATPERVQIRWGGSSGRRY